MNVRVNLRPLAALALLAVGLAVARLHFAPRVTPADIREAVELQNRATESFLRAEQTQDADAWIVAHAATASFADRESNVAGAVVRTDDVLELVRRLKAAGSRQVLIVSGLPNEHGVRSGLLIAGIPEFEPERDQVLNELSAFHVARGRPAEHDDGQRYETLLTVRE